MSIACVTFTYPKDKVKAILTSQSVPVSWDQYWVVESQHADEMKAAAPVYVTVLVRDFDRGTSLKGAAAIKGEIDVYTELAHDHDIIVKKDSDTAIFEPIAWTAMLGLGASDFAYIARDLNAQRTLCSGSCYSMSKAAVEKLCELDCREENIDLQQFDASEDLVISHYILWKHRMCGCQLNREHVHWCNKEYFGKDILAAHYGYVGDEEATELYAKHVALKG